MRAVGWLLFLAVGALWLALFFSGGGVLISGEIGNEGLDCTYFAGTGIAKRQYHYSENGLFGKSNCPTWIDVTS